MIRFLSTLLLSLALLSCVPRSRSHAANSKPAEADAPVFSGDSAYAYVKRQCDFGPRVPGSAAHRECLDFFVSFFSSLADTVLVQQGDALLYDGRQMPLFNVVASFNTDASNRLLLCAHWDSRPFADNDPDPQARLLPIDGANDGASGVGVLMELARLMNGMPPAVGVDIILFDLEDWGAPEWDENVSGNDWCLGSGYWASNPHVRGYSASYAVLLDMVGAPNATFYREYFSDRYAAWVVDKVWKRAESLGFSSFFVNRPGGAVTDDHVPLNQIAGIPAIDIIHYEPSATHGFAGYWHTHSDNISSVSPMTLNVVGTLLVDIIYRP